MLSYMDSGVKEYSGVFTNGKYFQGDKLCSSQVSITMTKDPLNFESHLNIIKIGPQDDALPSRSCPQMENLTASLRKEERPVNEIVQKPYISRLESWTSDEFRQFYLQTSNRQSQQGNLENLLSCQDDNLSHSRRTYSHNLEPRYQSQYRLPSPQLPSPIPQHGNESGRMKSSLATSSSPPLGVFAEFGGLSFRSGAEPRGRSQSQSTSSSSPSIEHQHSERHCVQNPPFQHNHLRRQQNQHRQQCSRQLKQNRLQQHQTTTQCRPYSSLNLCALEDSSVEDIVVKSCRDILEEASQYTLKAVELANSLRARVGTEVLGHVREKWGGLLSLLEKHGTHFRVDRIPKNDIVTLVHANVASAPALYALGKSSANAVDVTAKKSIANSDDVTSEKSSYSRKSSPQLDLHQPKPLNLRAAEHFSHLFLAEAFPLSSSGDTVNSTFTACGECTDDRDDQCLHPHVLIDGSDSEVEGPVDVAGRGGTIIDRVIRRSPPAVKQMIAAVVDPILDRQPTHAETTQLSATEIDRHFASIEYEKNVLSSHLRCTRSELDCYKRFSTALLLRLKDSHDEGISDFVRELELSMEREIAAIGLGRSN